MQQQAREALDKMSELRGLVEGLNWTIRGERARVAGIFDEELVRVRSVLTAALSES